jgi:cytochrome c553
VKVPGRLGLFPFLQLQSEGADARFDRTRKVYRDYHLDWFWNATTSVFKTPPQNTNFEGQCTACHSTGFTRFQDTATGTWLSDAVDDVSGCEACHGPGSDHVTWASNTANAGRQGRFIVNPAHLSPERSTQLCGRCHDRPVGNGPVQNEEPLDPQGKMALPGISRAEFLAQYTTRKGPAASDFWADGVHSKSHHQQYADFIKSTMYRNDRILTTCVDCHDSHGQGQFEHHTIYDQGIVNSYLCQRCHAIDPNGHMLEKTGQTHGGNSTLCIDCHMAKTAKTGAGKYGILLGFPTGTVSDDGITYFENDIASHRFLVPHRPNPSVAGQVPATAMPIPFTKSCGALCHDVSTLISMQPTSLGSGAAGQSGASGSEAHEPDDGIPAPERR